MSDIDEFLADAEKFVKTLTEKPDEESSLWDRYHPDSDDAEDRVPIGKLTQYSFNGDGFSPTSQTIKEIRRGVYSVDIVNRMLTFVPRKIVTDRLIRLPDSKSDEVIQRIQKFWTLKEQFKNGNEFANGGYLHKIGILLWGPAGSGKSCTIKFIIKDIIEKDGIVILGDNDPSVIKEGLRAFRSIEPNRPTVVIFEDFDELINKYSESGYLSLLDGEDSIDNALFIATTNYPSKLDPRLYNRPGRFSDVIKIGMPNAAARKIYLESQIKNTEEIEKIVKLTEGFSIDHLKALILGTYFEGRDLHEEAKRLRTLFKPPKDDNNESQQMGIRID